MTESDQTTRWRQAMSIGSRPAPGRGDCPDADTLALLIADPSTAPEGLLAHVERCSACSEELKSLGELPELETMVRQMAPRRPRLARWVPLAAAAGLLLAVGIVTLLPTPDPEPSLRAPRIEGIVPAEGARLDAPPERLDWSDALPGGRYRITLFNAVAKPIWQVDVTDATVAELPEDVRNRLQPGQYFWQLRELDSGAIRGPFSFEISDGEADA